MTELDRRCFIHIGTHKTGTTSIQAFLAENRSQLLELGVLVPRSAGIGDPRFACHHGIVRELAGLVRNDANGGLESILGELAASAAPVACISSEDISLLHDRPALLTRLRDGIRAAGFAPIVTVYLRPQVSYATAIYAENVLSGYRESFAAFLSDVITRGCYVWDGGYGPPFDYGTLIEEFAAVFGANALVVKRFRSGARDDALLKSFLSIIAPAAVLKDFRVPALRANRTLTFAGVLRRLGITNDLNEHVRFAPFTLRDLARCWLRFAPSNRRLAARSGLRIPVFEPSDLARALPIRRNLARTKQLHAARRELASVAGTLRQERELT